MSFLKSLAAGLLLFPTLSHSEGMPNLRVYTQNLHGYHPMKEPARFLEKRGEAPKLSEPYLTYFTPEEIERGQRRQLEALTQSIGKLKPDVIFLQEVGAGLPASAKDCAEFFREDGGDAFGRNSALRLRDRLRATGESYEAALACRANIGWRTDANTFRDTRVWRGKNGAEELVYDYGANPYPNGFIVEGTAILARAPWRLSAPREWNLPLSKPGESFFFQSAELRYGERSSWLLAVNLHGKWNVRHFEAAMALRRAIDDLVRTHPDRARFKGLVIGGDFNAPLFRPRSGEATVAGLAWELERAGEFDYSNDAPASAWEDLRARLWALNFKDGAFTKELGTEAEARLRTDQALLDYRNFARSGVNERLPLTEALSPANCGASAWEGFDAACTFPKRIDLLFHSPGLRAANATVLWSNNKFFTTEGISDHPGLLVDLRIEENEKGPASP